MRHVLFALIAAILFGTTGTAQALGPDGASSLSVGSARIVIGGAALALVAWLLSLRTRRMLRDPRPGRPIKEMLTLHIPAMPDAERQSKTGGTGGSRTWLVIAIGAAAIIAYQPAFFLGDEHQRCCRRCRGGDRVRPHLHGHARVDDVAASPVSPGLWLLSSRSPASRCSPVSVKPESETRRDCCSRSAPVPVTRYTRCQPNSSLLTAGLHFGVGGGHLRVVSGWRAAHPVAL